MPDADVYRACRSLGHNELRRFCIPQTSTLLKTGALWVPVYDPEPMIALIIALGLFAQGAPAGQGASAPGVVTGQVQTREGTPAAAVRVAAIPAPPPQAAE